MTSPTIWHQKVLHNLGIFRYQLNFLSAVQIFTVFTISLSDTQSINRCPFIILTLNQLLRASKSTCMTIYVVYCTKPCFCQFQPFSTYCFCCDKIFRMEHDLSGTICQYLYYSFLFISRNLHDYPCQFFSLNLKYFQRTPFIGRLFSEKTFCNAEHKCFYLETTFITFSQKN